MRVRKMYLWVLGLLGVLSVECGFAADGGGKAREVAEGRSVH